jgi:Secretion system C-terminal sorting domain
MKWIWILSVLIGTVTHLKGQALFSDNIDLAGYSDAAWQIAEKEGNYYMVTTSFCDLSPDRCIGIVKLNHDFSVSWKKTIEKTKIDQFTSIAVTDSFVFVVGRQTQPIDTLEITVLKIDLDGNTVAQWYYGNALKNTSYGIAAAFDGGFTFLYDENDSSVPKHTFMLRCDVLGNILWQKTIAEQYYASRLYTIHATLDSAYVLGMFGCLNTSCTALTGFGLKVDDNGNEIFSVARDSTDEEWDAGTYATFTKDGGAVFSRLEEAGVGVWDSQVLYRLDKNGHQLWEYHYDAGDYHRIWSIKEMKNGDILAVGFNEDHPYIDTTFELQRYWGGWLLRLSPMGEKKWERIIGDLRFPGDSFGEILDVVEVDDGSLVAAGTIIDTFTNGIPAPFNRDVWLLHLDSTGCVQTGCTGVFQGISGTSPIFDLSTLGSDFSISPNPAGGWALIKLAENSFSDDLSLILFDITGQIRLERKWPFGQKMFMLDISTLPSGIYILTLRSDHEISTKHLIIQK